jgi:tetratricopeptide (TPR) repeat protein
MKKICFSLIFLVSLCLLPLMSQVKPDFSRIDLKLIKGDFKNAADTCLLILKTDSLNSEVYYRLGLAYQNLLYDDKAFDCFLKASSISPDNSNYNFMVAKGYFSRGKSDKARPLLQTLYSNDSTNWAYAYYLTSTLMQEAKYDESIKIYARFYRMDSTNTMFMDKIGFANLRKGDFDNAIYFLSKSLTLNFKNSNTIKNLSYLYAATADIDTAVSLLTRGISMDPADMDLYLRRAAIYYSTNNNKRALNDYLKVISSGDSTTLYLKRAGIGYTNNLQPEEANVYLLLATRRDSTDVETYDYLARNYRTLKNLKKSEQYYNKIISLLTPMATKLEYSYINLAEEYKADGKYNEAISSYLKGQKMGPDMNIDMIIGNIYDEKLNNRQKAIQYYQKFLDGNKAGTSSFAPDYIKAVRDRLNFLIEKNEKERALAPRK